MADTKRVIEILLQIKQAGKEFLTQTTDAIKGITPAVTSANAATASLASSGSRNLQQVAAAGTAAGQQVAQGMKQGAAAGTNSFKDMLRDINAEAGKRSTVAQVTKLLAGGGAVAGFGLLASKLNEMTSALAENIAALRNGSIGWGEFIERLVASIPIIGQAWQAGRNLRDIITGEAEAAKKAAEAFDQMARAAEEGYKRAETMRKRFKDATADIAATLKAAGLELAQLSETDPDARAALKLRQERSEALGKLQKTVDDAAAQYLQIQSQLQAAKSRTAEALGTAGYEKAHAEFVALEGEADVALAIWKKLRDQVNGKEGEGGPAKAAVNALFDARAADAALQAQDAHAKKMDEEFSKAGRGLDAAVVQPWVKLFGVVSDNAAKWRDDMVKEAQKVKEAIASPAEKFTAERENVNKLFNAGVLTPEEFARARAMIDDQEAQLAADQLQAAQEAAQKRLEIQQRLAEQEQQLAEQLRQFHRAQDQASNDAALLRAQASHNSAAVQLAQIDAQAQAERDRWAEYRSQNLVDETTYRQALTDIDRIANEKHLEISGSFFDGLRSGFQQTVDAIRGPAQIGQQLAGDLTGGLTELFTSILSGSVSAAEAFKRFAASILLDVAKMIIEFEILSLVKAALGFFSPAVGGGGATLAGAPGEVAIPGGGVNIANKGGLITLGGVIRKFSRGGSVGGNGPDRDSVPALLTPGEFVVRRRVVELPGMLGLLQQINAGMSLARHSGGGMVTGMAGGGGGGGGSGGGIGSTQIVPAIVANDAAMRTLVNGGGNALIDWMRSNKVRINGVLQ